MIDLHSSDIEIFYKAKASILERLERIGAKEQSCPKEIASQNSKYVVEIKHEPSTKSIEALECGGHSIFAGLFVLTYIIFILLMFSSIYRRHYGQIG